MQKKRWSTSLLGKPPEGHTKSQVKAEQWETYLGAKNCFSMFLQEKERNLFILTIITQQMDSVRYDGAGAMFYGFVCFVLEKKIKTKDTRCTNTAVASETRLVDERNYIRSSATPSPFRTNKQGITEYCKQRNRRLSSDLLKVSWQYFFQKCSSLS